MHEKNYSQSLSVCSTGLEEIRLSDIEILDGLGNVRFGHHPFIVLHIDRSSSDRCLALDMHVNIEYRNIIGQPKLYIDYGLGLSELTGYELRSQISDVWETTIFLPNFVKSMRLDLGLEMKNGTAILRRISAQRVPLTETIQNFHAIAEDRQRELCFPKTLNVLYFLREYDKIVSRGNEEDNHIALASAIATGLSRPISINEPRLLPRDRSYTDLTSRTEKLSRDDIQHMAGVRAAWSACPKFSILMPVYDPPILLLDEAIKSLLSQNYENWELCIADDASPSAEVRDLIQRHATEDSRIKYVFREVNGHISEATNSAADLATGDFVVLMDNDDLIPSHALWTVAYYLNIFPDAKLLFSDEDKIDFDGNRCQPYFKCNFDLFLMYGHNMFSHLGIYKKTLFDEVGRFRKGYEGSQDYDLALRCVEKCKNSEIIHIPHVLYHWRQLPGSTSISADQKNYAFDAAIKSIDDHF